MTGGTDRMIRRWDAVTGDHIGTVPMNNTDDPLAAMATTAALRSFALAWPVTPYTRRRQSRRADLHGIFGRKIATLSGYNFSPALKQLDIVWTPETVAKLFEVGPMTYTPGTKMPEKTIGSAEDRAALVKFLEKGDEELASRFSNLARTPRCQPVVALAQIVLGGAYRRPRFAVGIEVLLGHHGDAAVLAHFDDVEAARRALEHPVLAFKLGSDALDRALHAERLTAANAVERLFLLEHARGGRGGAEVDLRLEADDLLRAGRLAQPALHAGVLGEAQHRPLGVGR